MVTKTDPDGQADMTHGNPYGLKQWLLQEISKLKKTLAQAERLLHSQEVIINDMTRAAVLRELVTELRRSAGSLNYDAGYEEMGGRVDQAKRLRDEANRIEAWVSYLETYGWVKKYLPCGSHECGQNTSKGLAKFELWESGLDFYFISAVYLKNHGPNIVFNRHTPAHIITAFIEANFDLEGKTGGYVGRQSLQASIGLNP